VGRIPSASTNNNAENPTSGLLTEFFDGAHPNDVCAAPTITDDSFNEGYTDGLTLGEWFSRPVKLNTYTWLANSDLGASFNPWYDYFNHPEIKMKLKGYSRLQANLHIKLVVNASPYHYGVGIMSYKPMAGAGLNGAGDFDFSAGMTSDLLVADAAPYTGGSVSASLMVKSTRPHAKFYAESSKGCEMQLPFCYYQNWINLDTDLNELKQMGNINIWTPVPLKDSSGNGGNVVVTIYAWCDDNKVAGPSYVMQSGEDEYKDRPVSTAMSAMSKAAGMLSIIPIVRPYAMATSKVMAGASTLARWFGFSNPPVIKDVVSYAPNFMSNFASPEISVQQDKLSLDPKNETTVDSRTVGLDGVDHMTIAHIVGRYVDYDVLEWTSADEAESPLLVQSITPMMAVNVPYTGATTGLNALATQMTPGCQIGTVFQFWSGKMTFKFTVIASQFHRGRLMISYDPDGYTGAGSAAYTGPRTINKIWDISTDPTFEFEVPWMAPIAMLRTGGLAGLASQTHAGSSAKPNVWVANPSGTVPAYRDAVHNGSIIVSVLNPLTSNDMSYGASVICSVNCAEVEYFSPMELEYPISLYKLQSGDDLANSPDEEVVHAEAPQVVDLPTKHAIYVGEVARSIRQLLHRTSFYSRFSTISPMQVPKSQFTDIPTINSSSTTDYYDRIGGLGGSIYLPNLPYVTGNFPVPVGYDYPNTGLLIKQDATTSADIVTNQNTKIMTPTAYFSCSYVGWRGGTVYTAKGDSSKPHSGSWNQAYGVLKSLSISRVTNSITDFVNYTSVWSPVVWRLRSFSATTLPANNDYSGYQALNLANSVLWRTAKGLSGMAATNPDKVDVVNAVVPYYSNNRMLPANPIANYLTANKSEDLPWNKTSFPSYPPGTNELIQCPRIDYDLCLDNVPVATHLDLNPSIDVYHKAGVDFTLFWYLNPPTIHMYTYYEGGYPRNWC